MAQLPGEDIARQNGYELMSYADGRRSAVYSKILPDGRCLNLGVHVCKENLSSPLEARLWSMHKMVTIGIPRFSFPHPKLALFEQQVLECVPVPRKD